MFVEIIIGINMKRLSFIAGAALVGMAAVSCGSRAEKIDGVETIDLDGTKVTWIRDNAEPRIMERSLFSDAPDSLMEALGLADGVPASVSVFLTHFHGDHIGGMLADDGSICRQVSSVWRDRFPPL